MDSFERLMEIAIERIVAGEDPPAEPIEVPKGEVIPHRPENYKIPEEFPNPPPAAPLDGIEGVKFVLSQCGMNSSQIETFMGSDIKTLKDLFDLRESKIEERIKELILTSGRGGAQIYAIQANVFAVCSLMVEYAMAGEGVWNAYEVSLPNLYRWKPDLFEYGDDYGINVDPPMFDPREWVSFKSEMIDYFRQVFGIGKVPLFYVIRDDDDPTWSTEYTTRYVEERVWNMPHFGLAFELNNAKVHRQLVKVLRGTEAWPYVAVEVKEGRNAWKRLCRQYDGLDEMDRRHEIAYQELMKVHYTSEDELPMTQYVQEMSKWFRILAQNGEWGPGLEQQKIKIFLGNIQNPSVYLLSHIEYVRNCFELRDNFERVTNFLVEAVRVEMTVDWTAFDWIPA